MSKRFAFCESNHATGTSLWHIRELTGQGLKLGGGADTQAISCGAVGAPEVVMDACCCCGEYVTCLNSRNCCVTCGAGPFCDICWDKHQCTIVEARLEYEVHSDGGTSNAYGDEK